MSDQQLYQQVILEHNKNPKNFGKDDSLTHHVEGYNPLCGDHYHLYLELDEEQRIQKILFEGQGCAISKASASMMTEKVKGLKAEEAKEIFEEFHQLVLGQILPEQTKLLGKLKIFSGIWKYPARVKCAALAWHTLKGALEDKKTVSTE